MKAFQKILVPLDGSRLAEAVLPVVTVLARQFGATVSLLHVLERGAPETVHGQRHLATSREAQAYLARVAEGCRREGVQVEIHVHPNEERDVVGSIVGHAGEFGADLIVVATHGWGGMRDILVGSIAQQVLRRGSMPVLLVKPTSEGEAPSFEGKRLLVPLNGRPDHDRAVLPVVEDVSRALGAHLQLLMVVPTLATLPGDQGATAILLPSATAAALDMEEEGARRYLARVAESLRGRKIQVSAEVRRGDPAGEVAAAAESGGADLIVMSIHARAGLEALWSGSIGSKILARTRQPLLLVKVPE
ncbi:MAG: universal stress protein [Sphingomonadaceae bacterium]